MSAVIVADALDPTVRAELAVLRHVLGRQPGQVLHFQKFSHSQRLKATQDIRKFSLATITNVIIHKNLIGQQMPAGNMAFISRPDPMYLWALRLLLERISWYVDEHGGTGTVVTFGHIKNFKVAKLHNYRQALQSTQTQIRWHVFAGRPFHINSPDRVELLQVADSAASALFRAVEPDQFGNPEPRYLQELRPVIYRRPPGNVTSYGLKVFPSAEASPGGSLDWLRSY